MEVDLKLLKKNIENFSHFHQVEILKILKSNDDIILNENKNGIFINLSSINSSVINNLQNYVTYVKKQENQLNELEQQKDMLANTYFKENKTTDALYMS
tara:strand:+ start:1682 stop:1978 length:297 start_codon:yes stop_codon:yes gene_type:complete